MSTARTEIAWTDRTWNVVRGCSRVSLGCGGPGRVGGCYAERQAHRFNYPGGPYEGLTRMTENGPRWTGVVRLIPEALDEPLRWRKPQRVFVNSMSDLFHESLPDDAIATVFGVMAAAPDHTFQILTKRPKRMREWFSWVCDTESGEAPWDLTYDLVSDAHAAILDVDGKRPAFDKRRMSAWPLPNVWLGVSVEDQATADERIPLLLQTPAAVRFVSYEPALGPVDFSRTLTPNYITCQQPDSPAIAAIARAAARKMLGWSGIDWLIVGGESGPGARDFYLAWARSAIAQCKAAGVPVFTKQVGARPIERCPECYGSGASIPANTSGTCPECRGDGIVTLRLRDRKGGLMEEWPSDLRVREFPAVPA